MKTKIIEVEDGIRLEIEIIADKNGMVSLGNNTVVPLKTLTKFIRDHGLSYVKLPGEPGLWITPPPKDGE